LAAVVFALASGAECHEAAALGALGDQASALPKKFEGESVKFEITALL
jgi:hypothetical protein